MPTKKPEQEIRVPKGADATALRRLAREADTDWKRQNREERRDLVKHVKRVAHFNALTGGQPPARKAKAQRDLTKIRTQMRKEVMAIKPPPKVQPLKGHNVARYAPYDLAESWDGADGATEAVRQRGPNLDTGHIGGSAVAKTPFGYASVGNYMGFWVHAWASGTLHVHSYVRVLGAASLFSDAPDSTVWTMARTQLVLRAASHGSLAWGNRVLYNNGRSDTIDMVHEYRNVSPIHMFDSRVAGPVERGNDHLILLGSDIQVLAYSPEDGAGHGEAAANWYLWLGPVYYYID